MKEQIKRSIPFLVYYMLIAFGFFLGHVSDATVSTDLAVFEEHKKAAPSFLMEMGKLLVSVSVLVFGGVGYLALNKEKQIQKGISYWEQGMIIATLVLSSLAIYFVFVMYSNSSQLLDVGVFSVSEDTVRVPFEMAYYCLSGAILVLGTLFIRRLNIGE